MTEIRKLSSSELARGAHKSMEPGDLASLKIELPPLPPMAREIIGDGIIELINKVSCLQSMTEWRRECHAVVMNEVPIGFTLKGWHSELMYTYVANLTVIKDDTRQSSALHPGDKVDFTDDDRSRGASTRKRVDS